MRVPSFLSHLFIGEKLPSLDGNYRRVPIPDLVIGPDGNHTSIFR